MSKISYVKQRLADIAVENGETYVAQARRFRDGLGAGTRMKIPPSSPRRLSHPTVKPMSFGRRLSPELAVRVMESLVEESRERNRKRKVNGRVLPAPTRPEPSACECCDQPQVVMRARGGSVRTGLSMDHCHATGAFRGWLCQRCNTGIGLLGDGPDGLRRALAYLEPLSTVE